MRWLGRSLFVLILLLAAWWFWLRVWPSWRLAWQAAFPPVVTEARPVQMVMLDAKQAVQWGIPDDAHLLRVRLVAQTPTAPPEIESAPIAVRWRLFDGRAQLLHEKIEHRVLPWSQQLAKARLVDGDQQWSAAVLTPLFVSLEAWPQARQLSLDLPESNGETKVATRVLDTRFRNDDEAALRWRRMSERRREEASRTSVIPPALMERVEREAFARRNLRPLGPSGVSGNDFRPALLYLEATQDAEQHERALDPGWPLQAKLAMAWRAAAGEWEVHVIDASLGTRLQVYSVHSSTRDHWLSLDLPVGESRHRFNLSADQAIAIEANRDLRVRLLHQGVRQDYPVGDTHWFFALNESPVSYRFVHPLRGGFRVRLEARALPDARPAPSVQWRALDAQGRILQSGVLQPSLRAHPYDRLANDIFARTVGPATRLDLTQTARLNTLEIEGTPGTIGRVLNAWAEPGQPLFSVRPVQVSALMAERRSRAVWLPRLYEESPTTPTSSARRDDPASQASPIPSVASPTLATPPLASSSAPSIAARKTQVIDWREAGASRALDWPGRSDRLAFRYLRSGQSLHSQTSSHRRMILQLVTRGAVPLQVEVRDAQGVLLQEHARTAVPLPRGAERPSDLAANAEIKYFQLPSASAVQLKVLDGEGFVRLESERP